MAGPDGVMPDRPPPVPRGLAFGGGGYNRQAGLSIDFDHSPAALCGSTSFFPYLFHAIRPMVVSTLADMCGRSFTIASSKDEIH